MSTATIPVDLLNPGQVFACLGLVELNEVLFGEARGCFDWTDPTATKFILAVEGDANPVAAALDFLAKAEVRSLAPPDSELVTEKWGVATVKAALGDAFPIPVPSSPAPLPAILSSEKHSIELSSWGETNLADSLGTGRDNVKFWAGSGGYPGVGLLRDALDLVRAEIGNAYNDPFSLSAPQSSSFRFDWRRDYIPLDVGFSLNEHGKMQPKGYPLVEVLALIGLSHARPRRVRKLEYRYAVLGRVAAESNDRDLLPAPLLRAGLGGGALPFPTRHFTMLLDWPGQENQARCITTVREETLQ